MSSLTVGALSLISKRSLSYFHQPGKYPLKYITVGQLFEKAVEKFGSNTAIISKHQNKSLTYEKALEECDKLAVGFSKIGLKKGDKLGLWCPNLIEWFIINFACARAGLVLVALNPNYQIPEIEYSINKVGIKCLICPEELGRMKYYEMLDKLISNLDKKEVGKLNTSRTPTLESVITISEDTLKGTYNLKEIMERSNTEEVDKIKMNQHEISPDDGYTILFSSGTTGQPKAAVVSHFSQVNNAMNIGRRTGLNEKLHKICVMVPFFHAFGLTITTFSSVNYGTTLVIPSAIYNVTDNLTAIKEEKCTMLHGTPTMYADLIVEQEKRNENITPEVALSGGAPISSHQMKTMLRVLKLKTVKSVYGLTETTAMVFTSQPGDDETKSIETVGALGDFTEAKVVDENNKIVPFGTPGELCLRGYQNMIGYYGDKAKTEATLGSDGWLRTGDQFILTEDGYGRIVGRLKDMLIRGGENIFPKEIEDVLNTHKNIKEVHVIGLPHDRLGEEVCACIQTKDNTPFTMDDLKQFCNGKMAHFKIPSQVRMVENFPKTTSGKIQKYKLVEQFSKIK